MSKALYGFITYPESIKTEEMQNFLESRKFDFAYCLHNKDVHKDGTPKKGHVHWLVGFEKKALSVKEMLLLFGSRFYIDVTEKQSIPEEMQNLTEAVSGFRPPAEYEMPTGERKPLITHLEIMRSSQGSEDYLEHKNNPEKADYSGKAYYSQYWDISSYFTYEEKRRMKRAERSADYAGLYKLISELPETVRSFNSLLAFIVEKSPDLLPLAIDKAYAVEKLLKSRNTDLIILTLSNENKKLQEENAVIQAENQRLKEENDRLQESIFDLTEQNGILFSEYLEQTGENPTIE